MFVVLLRFSANKAKAPDLMEAHNAWIKQGIEDGLFLVVGSLHPKAGGAIIAHGVSRDAINARVNDDPFVVHDVVAPEILEITPGRTDDRLAFLMEEVGS